jgi:hypothetical protein
MPRSPSIVPSNGQDVYLVVEDLGKLGTVWREADAAAGTDYETVIRDMLSGQYKNPTRVVSFNTVEGWSRDVSAEMAEELRQRCEMERRELPPSIRPFIERFDKTIGR